MEPPPKIPFQIPYLKKQISLPQLQEKEVKVQISVSSQTESKITFYQEKVKVSISFQEKVELSHSKTPQ